MEREIYCQMAEYEEYHWWFVSRRRIIETLVSKVIPDLDGHSKILDAGCGTGGNLKSLKLPSDNMVGMEPDPQAAGKAAEKSGKPVYHGKLPDQIPFPSENFDLILILDVLEHLDDDLSSLRALVSKLKPGGHVLITVPAFKFLWSDHDESHHHRRRYLLSELQGIIKSSGLSVKYGSYYNFWLFPVVFLLRATILKKLIKNSSSDLVKTTKIINWLLSKIMSSEKNILKRRSLPFGVSIIAIGKK